MRKFSIESFYVKNVLWILFCLGVAFVCYALMTAATNLALQKNETRAAWSVADIRRLQNEYSVKHGGKYASTFDELIREVNLDEDFRGRFPVVSGYIFSMGLSLPDDRGKQSYVITATPLEPEGKDQTGRVHFYTDSTLGTIRATRENRPATAEDPTI